MSDKNTEVFISFSFKDQNEAAYIVDTLQNEYDISCWFCIKDDHGTKYKEEIPEAILNSRVVVVFISKNSVISDDVSIEVGYARDNSKEIIPFKLDNSAYKGSLVYDLQNKTWIEIKDDDIHSSIELLADKICHCLGKVINKKSSKKQNERRFELKDYIEKLEDFEGTDAYKEIAILHNNIAVRYCETGVNDLAEDYYMSAIEYARKIPDMGFVGQIYSNLAYFYNTVENNKQAIKCYEASLKILENEFKDGQEVSSSFVKTLLDYLVTIEGSVPSDYLIKACKRICLLGDNCEVDDETTINIAMIYELMGNTYLEGGKISLGRTNYKKALDLLSPIEDNWAYACRGRIYKSIGGYFFGNEEDKKAHMYLHKAFLEYFVLTIRDSYSFEADFAWIAFLLGLSCQDLNERKKYLFAAYEMAERHNENEECQQIIDCFSDYE